MDKEANEESSSSLSSMRNSNGAPSSGDIDTVVVDDAESLEELVRLDPSVTYARAFSMVASILWKNVICQTIRPLSLFSIYLVLGGVYYLVFPHNNMVWMVVLAALALPAMATALFLFVFTRQFVNKRYPPFESAQTLLLERIRVGRAKRKKDAYDLFLPPPPSSSSSPNGSSMEPTTDDAKKIGVVFFPGALVNHTSYATMASKLSDRGILVVVLSLEPIRFDNNTEANKKRALDAMREVGSSESSSDAPTTVDEWVLSGHSAGAHTAITLASEMDMNPIITRLLLCGTAEKFLDELAPLKDPPRVLLVNGSEDTMVGVSSNSKNSKGSNGTTTIVTIEGGNHAGFGHYGPQGMDGIRTIPLEEQQEIFAEKTMEFLTADIQREANQEEKLTPLLMLLREENRLNQKLL